MTPNQEKHAPDPYLHAYYLLFLTYYFNLYYLFIYALLFTSLGYVISFNIIILFSLIS